MRWGSLADVALGSSGVVIVAVAVGRQGWMEREVMVLIMASKSRGEFWLGKLLPARVFVPVVMICSVSCEVS